MNTLVKFIAVDNKDEISNNEAYIEKIYKAIHAAGLIKNLNIKPNEMALGVGPVRELDDEGNAFLLEFTSEEYGKSNIWSIYFIYGTYDASKQIEISIDSDTYIPEANDGYLEKLKLCVKKCIRRDWDKVIWLVDKDSECLSVSLYPMIYRVENLMREVINEVMTKQYGTSWWDSYAPANIKSTHSKRLKEYKLRVPSFSDVDEKLMSIYIDDLGKLIKTKRYKWNPVFDETISALLNGVQSCNDARIRELLSKQLVVETDLWKDQFSNYLAEDFNERYEKFSRDRNHIMHNKLIDRAAYRTMKELIEQIEEDLTEAIKKIQSKILSKEEKFEIEKQKQIERQMLELVDHECRENDANVSIRDNYEITELFQDSISSFLTGIEDTLRFRDDLEITSSNSKGADSGELLTIKSKIDDTCLAFSYEMEIDDSEGADSTLSFRCDNEKFEVCIGYKNGEVEYDDESGLYMPITEDEIDSVDGIIDEMIDFIEGEFPSYIEAADAEDIAESLMCSECGSESICIKENVLPIGTCMNCGYVNSVHECDRCHAWFNSDEDGSVIDEIAFCQNCLDEMEEE